MSRYSAHQGTCEVVGTDREVRTLPAPIPAIYDVVDFESDSNFDPRERVVHTAATECKGVVSVAVPTGGNGSRACGFPAKTVD